MPLIKPDGERIATIEQQMKDLQDKLNEVGSDVKEVRGMMQVKLNDHVVLSNQVASLEKEVNELKKLSTFWKWFAPIASALAAGVLASILTFLIINFLNNVK